MPVKYFLILFLFTISLAAQDSNHITFTLVKSFSIPGDVHGILVTDADEILCGSGKNIYKISTDGEVKLFSVLNDTTSKTYIWSLFYSPANTVVAAADDKLYEIFPDGSNKVVYKSNFSGEWGACDIKYDNEGNLLVVHGKYVSMFDENFNRKDVVVDTSAKNFVGIGFNSSCSYFLLSDVFSAKVFKYSYSKGRAALEKTFENIRFPEYISFDKDDEAIISLPGRNKIVSIDKDDNVHFYLLGDEYVGINTLQVKNTNQGEELLYISRKNVVQIFSLKKN